jgi:diguanylate cyclase (GGDEF)-like protein/PAS domain S-box-containing protein
MLSRDITDRKISEEKLRESEERFRILVQSLDDIVFTLDTQQRHTGVYGGWLQNGNLTHEFFIGKTARNIFGPDSAAIHEKANAQALEGKTVSYEWSAEDETGTQYFQTVVSPLLNTQGKISGIVGIGRNITARKQYEETIQKANENLEARLNEIEALQTQLREQAIRDALTGLFNRRYLQETLEREIARAERSDLQVGFIIMDVDEFKLINDQFGHRAGDLMLQEIGKMILANIRLGDIPCRYGGEEFVIVMPGAPLQAAVERAHLIRKKFEEMRVMLDSHNLHATVSIGVSAYPLHGSTGEKALNRADRALYKAKQSGRNQVAVFQETDEHK